MAKVQEYQYPNDTTLKRLRRYITRRLSPKRRQEERPDLNKEAKADSDAKT